MSSEDLQCFRLQVDELIEEGKLFKENDKIFRE
jgi:hypothetical protein